MYTIDNHPAKGLYILSSPYTYNIKELLKSCGARWLGYAYRWILDAESFNWAKFFKSQEKIELWDEDEWAKHDSYRRF